MKRSKKFRLPELRPEEQVLLLCARTEIPAALQDEFHRLVGRVGNWDVLIEKAVPHKLSSLVYHHLINSSEAKVPGEVLNQLRLNVFEQSIGYLRIAAVQKKLSSNVLKRHAIPHVFFKGVGLAEELYPNPSYRPSRDIDVWIDPSLMGDVWDHLMGLGFKRLQKLDQTHQIPADHAAYLLPTVDVVSPEGVLIEIHMRYDQSGLTIDPAEIYSRSREISTSIGSIRVPSFEDHFMYACQHHSRHLWARLRWLADLDAFERSEHFNQEQLHTLASGTALAPTITACLDMWSSLSAPDFSTNHCQSDHGLELKYWLFRSIVEGPSIGNQKRESRASPDFALPWQYGWSHIVRLKINKLKPTQADYLDYPLERKSWWKYYFTRPIRLIRTTRSLPGESGIG